MTNTDIAYDYLLQGKKIPDKFYKKLTFQNLKQIAKKRGIKTPPTKRKTWILLNTKYPSIDSILLSLNKLQSDTTYTEFKYNNFSYPVIQDEDIKFAVIPSNTIVYKALPKNYDILTHFKSKDFPIPSFYGTLKTAEEYKNVYFPKGNGIVKSFITKRPAKMFILNDVNNLIKLAKLFSETDGVHGLLKRTRKEAVRELMLVTGLGTTCLKQNKYKQEVESILDIKYHDYNFNVKLCRQIKDEKLKRLSLYGIDVNFSKNLCIVLKLYGCDGYIANDIPTAFSEYIPIFNSELMFCFSSDVLGEI